jgi:hypothetical protein
MSRKRLIIACGFVSIVLVLVSVVPAAAYVTPQIGGGQVGMMAAPMIMPEIAIVGTNVVVQNMMGMPWMPLMGVNRPVLRPLTGTDAFNPTAIYYNALNGKAYNFQYGWAPEADLAASLPAGDKIWIELISQSQGLNTYDRNNSSVPIFGTNGAIWKFDETQSMIHNYYAVTPGYGDWSATYKVYLGDATTGAALCGFGSDTVTFTWSSIPEPAAMALMGTGLAYLLGFRRKHKAAA